MATPFTRDAQGFESQLATNHIGHFRLTLRLWQALERARGARVVALSAATSVWCATSPALADAGGVYCEDVDIAEAVPADFPEPRGVRPWATDPELAERLWRASEQWTGLRFGA